MACTNARLGTCASQGATWLAATLLAAILATPAVAANTITYQGRLSHNGAPVNGTRDMTFSL